jgi:uracil-DNA glycosylase family 4
MNQNHEPMNHEPMRSLLDIRNEIVACERCPRLRKYCLKVGREKRAAYRKEIYWGRPVPGFGDPAARIVIVGLAPAAHGANRTGRIFTGDGTGGSGDFLMAALRANRLANHDYSRSADDGLVLDDVWMLAAVRCAPPGNKPLPREFANCYPHMRNEIAALTRARVYVALGRLAFDACRQLLRDLGFVPPAAHAFSHGGVTVIPGGPTVVSSYHPSRQNTHTGRLTPAMLRDVFRKALKAADRAPRT